MHTIVNIQFKKSTTRRAMCSQQKLPGIICGYWQRIGPTACGFYIDFESARKHRTRWGRSVPTSILSGAWWAQRSMAQAQRG